MFGNALALSANSLAFIPGLILATLTSSSHALASAKTTMACEKIVSAFQKCHPGITYDSKTDFVQISPYASRVVCNDGRNLDFYDRLDHMDVASELMIPYSTGVVPLPNRTVNSDGGRLRFNPLYFEVYGSTRAAVVANLVSVKFLNQVILFNRQNGAAAALGQVNTELLQLIKTDKVLANYLKPWLTGKEDLRKMTFNWRKIAQSPRLSNHSFGAAIDLNDPNAHGGVYWLWELAAQRQREILKRTKKHVSIPDLLKKVVESQTQDFHPQTLSAVPQVLVDVFEKYGFVWGGKWYHFDGMHFEYRPEFLTGIHPVCPSAKLASGDDLMITDSIRMSDATIPEVSGDARDSEYSPDSERAWLLENAHFD